MEAILVDFDHTLANLGDFVRWEDGRLRLLRLYRASGLPEAFLQAHSGMLNLYRDVMVSGLLSADELHEVQREASQVLGVFEKEAIDRASLFPEALAFAEFLPKIQLKAGVVTANSADVVSIILKREGIADRFRAVVGRDEVTYLKPSPDGLIRCCEIMGVAPHACIYIGDSPNDIKAAQAAGMPGFGVRTGFSSHAELAKANPEAIFESLSELLVQLGDRK